MSLLPPARVEVHEHPGALGEAGVSAFWFTAVCQDMPGRWRLFKETKSEGSVEAHLSHRKRVIFAVRCDLALTWTPTFNGATPDISINLSSASCAVARLHQEGVVFRWLYEVDRIEGRGLGSVVLS